VKQIHTIRLTMTALLALTVSRHAVQAQAVPDRAAATELRKQFMTDLDTLQSKMVALAGAFPEDKFSWRPAPGVRSVGEVFMHVASEYYVYTPLAFGAARSTVIPKGPEGFKAFEAKATKADVMQALHAGFDYMRQSVMALPPDSIAGVRKLFGQNLSIMETTVGMTADLHEHLGQLIAYARMNGVTPPWSK
jgi:hypothetical protein